MGFKEKVKEFGCKVRMFCKEHKREILIVTGGLATAGLTYYGISKAQQNYSQELPDCITETEDCTQTIDEKTAWNKDWDAQALALEFATHQPLGPFRDPGEGGDEDGYIDPLDGISYIVAGPNSYYNDSPDTVEIYALDNEGYFHRLPDDVRNA